MGAGPRYTGSRFEYHVIDIAAEVARYGVFIIPQEMAPFRYSGYRYFTEKRGVQYERFERQTGITLGPGCGIDTSFHVDGWRGVAPRVEVVTVDFPERKAPAAAVPSQRDWRTVPVTEFTAKPKASQTALFPMGDDDPCGTTAMFGGEALS